MKQYTIDPDNDRNPDVNRLMFGGHDPLEALSDQPAVVVFYVKAPEGAKAPLEIDVTLEHMTYTHGPRAGIFDISGPAEINGQVVGTAQINGYNARTRTGTIELTFTHH